MAVGIDSVVLLIHLLFFVFWLGTDLGVFYSSGFVMKTDIGAEARGYCLKIMSFLDQVPRVSSIGVAAAGFTVGILRGYIALDPIWILPIWIIAFVWAGVVLYLYVNEHHPEKIATVKRADFYWRFFMVALIFTLAITSWFGNGITDQKWLAAKLFVFGLILSCGVMLRVQMRTFGQFFGPMMKGTATPEQIATAQAMMWGAKRYVLGIYVLLIVAAALGLWKPF